MAIPLEKLYAIAETLSISITDLLIEEDEIVENELPDLIKEYKEIESQELRNALIRSLFEGIRICEEKVKRAENCKGFSERRNSNQHYFANDRHLFRRNSTSLK